MAGLHRKEKRGREGEAKPQGRRGLGYREGQEELRGVTGVGDAGGALGMRFGHVLIGTSLSHLSEFWA